MFYLNKPKRKENRKMKLFQNLDFREALTFFLCAGFMLGLFLGKDVSQIRDVTLGAVAFYFANKSTMDKM
jgi:hypothetical protein